MVYKAVSPSGKYYIGITNNFKRRMKEHRRSKYPFGRALRKYGQASFTFEFVENLTLDEAYEIEELLIGIEEVKSDKCYNISCGGRPDIQIGKLNPMHREDVKAKHTNLWDSENNPMKDPVIKARAMKSNEKYKKRVLVEGREYLGVRVAARDIGISRQCLVHRIKSINFPDYKYL